MAIRLDCLSTAFLPVYQSHNKRDVPSAVLDGFDGLQR